MSDDSKSVLKRIALVIGKILAYGVAWFLLGGISVAIFENGFGMGEDPAVGWGLLVSTLVIGMVWMWRMGLLKWNREDSEAEDSSSEEVPSEIAVEDRKSDRRLEESGDWYWAKKGSDERNGPVRKSQLEKLAKEGGLESDDLVWTGGMDEWEEASSVEGVKDVFASPPPLPDESEEEGDAQEEAPPSLPRGGKKEESIATKTEGDRGRYPLPMEFKVEWGGLLATNESTLELRESGVSLRTDDVNDHGGEVDYRHIEIEEIDGNDVTLQAPFAFKRDNAGKATHISSKNHYLTFESKDFLKRAVNAIEDIKSSDMLIENKTDTETANEEKVTADNGGEDSFWKRHPIWTGIAFLFVLGAVSNALDGSTSTSGGASSTECMEMAGTHTGIYHGAGETGNVRVEIESDCDYEVYMDGQRLAAGTFDKNGNTLTFENGNSAQYSGGTISWTENTSMGMVVYEAS